MVIRRMKVSVRGSGFIRVSNVTRHLSVYLKDYVQNPIAGSILGDIAQKYGFVGDIFLDMQNLDQSEEEVLAVISKYFSKVNISSEQTKKRW